jgi:hypothetical protein
MAERLELTLGIAGPREEEVQSQAVVQEQDLNKEPTPRTESPEVKILLTQPPSSRRRPREEQEQQEGSREDRLTRHPRFRRPRHHLRFLLIQVIFPCHNPRPL